MTYLPNDPDGVAAMVTGPVDSAKTKTSPSLLLFTIVAFFLPLTFLLRGRRDILISYLYSSRSI